MLISCFVTPTLVSGWTSLHSVCPAVQTLSVAHVFHVWWLHGLTYKPMDAVLFLDIRSFVFAIHGKIRYIVCSAVPGCCVRRLPL